MTNEIFQEIVLSELRDLKDGQGRVEERLTKVEDGLSRLEERQTNLEHGLSRLEEKQSILEQGIVRLEEKQTTLEDGMSRVEERQTKFEKKLDLLYDQTVISTEGYTEINTKLDNIDTKIHKINTRLDILTDDFKSIHEILGEHEVSIRTLRKIDFERRKEYYEAMSRENEAMVKENFPVTD